MTTKTKTARTRTTPTARGEGWTEATDAALETALTVARGKYQRNLLGGWESLSGSTLRGAAAKYSGRYRASAAELLRRVAALGVRVTERRAENGRRVLVLA